MESLPAALEAHLGDLPALVVATYEGDAIWVPDLQQQILFTVTAAADQVALR